MLANGPVEMGVFSRITYYGDLISFPPLGFVWAHSPATYDERIPSMLKNNDNLGQITFTNALVLPFDSFCSFSSTFTDVCLSP